MIDGTDGTAEALRRAQELLEDAAKYRNPHLVPEPVERAVALLEEVTATQQATLTAIAAVIELGTKYSDGRKVLERIRDNGGAMYLRNLVLQDAMNYPEQGGRI